MGDKGLQCNHNFHVAVSLKENLDKNAAFFMCLTTVVIVLRHSYDTVKSEICVTFISQIFYSQIRSKDLNSQRFFISENLEFAGPQIPEN